MPTAAYLLSKLLECTEDDLKILERPGIDLEDVVEFLADKGQTITLESIMCEVFFRGLEQFEDAIKKRKDEVYGKKTKKSREVYGALISVCAWIDIEWSFNYLDTHVFFVRNEPIYRQYLAAEIEEVEKMIGYSIE